MHFIYVTDERLDDRLVKTIHIDQVCRSLSSLGHSVTLFAPWAPSFNIPQEYSVRFVKGNRWLSSIFFQARLYRALRREIRERRPDILYVRHNYLLFVPALVAKSMRIPLVLECNGKLLEEARVSEYTILGRTLLKLKVFYLIEKYNMRRVSLLVVVAAGIRDYCMKLYDVPAQKIAIVLNGVDTEFFKPYDSHAARTQLGLDTAAVYVGYVGSFYPWQGLKYIAKAAREVVEKRDGVKFLIVGRGEDEEWLRAYVKENSLEDRVEVRKAVPHALVPTYMSALDVCLCYPSRFRDSATSPFKVYEYLACGKPVILGGIEGVCDEFDGAVKCVEPESPTALAAGILSLVDDAAMREKLGSAGRTFVENGHNWTAVTQKLVALCEPLVAAK